MSILLMMLLAVLGVSDTFGLDLSLGPGLSVKNAMFYMVALVLLLRMVIGGGFKIEMAGVQICFGILIAYAMTTWLVAGLFVQYPTYSLVSSGIVLKSALIDYAIFFFVFFYGIRTQDEAILAIKGLTGVVALTSAITVADVMGGLNIGVAQVDSGSGFADRLLGAFGSPNSTGAIIASLLPSTLAVVSASRRMWRIVWLGAVALNLTVLLMAASRSSIVGLLIGGVWALILCRQYVSMGRVVKWAFLFLLIAIPVLAIVSVEFGQMLKERFVSQSSAVDMGEISSGRTEFWKSAVERMMSTPLTLITGFGWDVYDSMGFRYATHNHYLSLWFNLGLVGLISFGMILRQAVVAVRRAMGKADEHLRGYLIAALFGLLTMAVMAFFGNMNGIWLYLWAFIGISLRMACIANARTQQAVAVGKPEEAAPDLINAAQAERQRIAARPRPRY